MSKSKMLRHMTVGAILGGVLFSGVSYAANSMNITVNFLPLKYYFDGVEKKAPTDQQGFIYKGTTYVPIRFVSESLGKKVGYDGKTTSIYVGKQKEGTVTYLKDAPLLSAVDNNSRADRDTYKTNRDEVFEQFWVAGRINGAGRAELGSYSYQYILDGNYKTLSGLLAPHEIWKGNAPQDNIGSLKIYADDVIVYDSGAISSTLLDSIKVEADITGALVLRIEMSGQYTAFLDPKLIS
ncbi:stalk domain-containing protein [Paenibacillus sp. NRS-1760]|uniref:stalk domain-containing protein n=1 Tax=Paenibacillus sp. NRS-1760 TaxID=3233902 RepID=UPI003D2C64B1